MGLRHSFREALAGAADEWRRTRRAILDGEDHEALHRMRLLIKRLRAWRRWLRPSRRTRSAWLRMRRAYREAGRIRDHALLNSGQEAPGNAGPEHTPDWTALRNSLRPLRPGRTGPFFRSLGERLERHPHPRRALRRHLRTRMARVRLLREGLPDEATLHRIRRDLKEMLYLMQLWVGAKPGDLAARRFLQWLDQRQDQLGAWHDQVLHDQALAARGASAPEQEATRAHAKDLEEQAILELEGLELAGRWIEGD